MTRILITGGTSIGSKLAKYLDDQGSDTEEYSGNNLAEASDTYKLIKREQEKPVMATKDNSKFIQQKMQGKRRVY